MWMFAVPMILGNLLQQAYNVVDTWAVGHYVGSNAVAAVGSAFTLMNFLTSILLGLCMGSGIVVSYCFARRDNAGLKDCVQSAFVLIAAIAILLTVLSTLGIDKIIMWLNIPEEIVPLIRSYLYIVFLGIPAVFIYNYFAAYMKAIGNAIVPLLFLGLAAFINIVLDLWFIAKLGWGTAGAGYATIMAQYVSAASLSAYVLYKDSNLRQALCTVKWRLTALREVLSYSVFTCLQQSIMNLGILSIQGLVNSFGATSMAAFAAAAKVDSFAFMPAIEYTNAFSTFVAQNKGVQKTDRIKTAIVQTGWLCVAYGAVASFITWIAAKQLMTIFIDEAEAHVINAGVEYLHIEGAFYFGFSILFLFYGLYRALGKPHMSFVLTIVSLGTRVLISYSLAHRLAAGVLVIWWSIPTGWILADLVGLLYFLRKRKEFLM